MKQDKMTSEGYDALGTKDPLFEEQKFEYDNMKTRVAENIKPGHIASGELIGRVKIKGSVESPSFSPGVSGYRIGEKIEVDVVSMTNLASNPAGPSSVGDMCVVSGKLKICSVAGTPGTWVVVGSQS